MATDDVRARRLQATRVGASRLYRNKLYSKSAPAKRLYHIASISKHNRIRASDQTSLNCCIHSSYGLITIAIGARFEYDSTTIRLQHATTRYEVFRSLAYEIVYENQW